MLAPLRLAAALAVLALMGPLVASIPAAAEVRFGNNVRVGGHDFSNRTYSAKRRAVIHIYNRTPPHQGCRWRSDGRGGKDQICHLRRKGR